MATDSKWRKDLGFLEGLMFDPVAGGILGGLQGLMGIFQTNEQNSLIDDAVNNYEKMKITEDQMGRRQSEVKRMYGSMVDSMIGAGQYLNSDTARAMQNAKLTGQSVEAQLKQRMTDEQRNLQIDDQINKLKGSKKGLLEPIANTFGGALQGVFNATQLGMSMDSKEKEQDMIDRYMNPEKYKNEPVVSSLTGESITKVPKLNIDPKSALREDLTKFYDSKPKIDYSSFLTDDQESVYEKDRIDLANYIAEESTIFGNVYNPQEQKQSQIFNRKLDPLNIPSVNLMPNLKKLFSNRRWF